MRKIIIVLLLLASTLSAAALEWPHDYKKALIEAQDADLPLLIYVKQPGCGVCEWMEENAFADDTVQAYLQKHYKIAKFDLGDKALPKHLKPYATPTFYILNTEGRETGETLMGGKTPESFLEYLEEGYFFYTHQVKQKVLECRE